MTSPSTLQLFLIFCGTLSEVLTVMRLMKQSGFIFTGSIFQQQTSVPTCQITQSHNLEDCNFKVSVLFSAFPNKGVGVVKGMVLLWGSITNAILLSCITYHLGTCCTHTHQLVMYVTFAGNKVVSVHFHGDSNLYAVCDIKCDIMWRNTRNVLVHLYELQYCVRSCSVLSFITTWNLDWKLTYVCLALSLA
jgi:hypothetical protein